VHVPPTSILQPTIGLAYLTAQPVSFDAKLINVFHSGGNVTLWMTVAMDLTNLMTVLNLNVSQAGFSVALGSVLCLLSSVMERMTVETILMNSTVTHMSACQVSSSVQRTKNVSQ